MKRYFVLMFLCLLTCAAMGQRKVPFNGILLDLFGTPIRKAHVYVKTSKDYALTDKKGRFGLTNVMATDSLKIEVEKKLYVVPVEGKKSMIIRLADAKKIETKEDQELVDVGFGFVSRREYTGVSNIISGEELRRSGATSVLGALQGRVPGLEVSGTGGQGEQMDISMRGTRSFTASSTPVFVINDIVVPSFDGINLNDIDYVEVMKDASVYGSNGANGAILVRLKSGN